jgi:hypothetical protein
MNTRLGAQEAAMLEAQLKAAQYGRQRVLTASRETLGG